MTENQINIIVEDFVKKFKKDNPNCDKILINQYEEYLKSSIVALQRTSLPWIKKDENTIRKILEADLIQLRGKSPDEITYRITSDEHYEKIRKISNKAYNLAVRVLQGEKIEIETINDLDREIKECEEDILKVREKEKSDAESLYSEAILDLHYIKTQSPEATSLRLGNIMSRMKGDRDL